MVIVLLPLIVSERAVGLVARRVKATCQVPSLAAVVATDWPAKSTVIFSPGEAEPQTGTRTSLWRTMWSEKMAGRETSARAERAPAASARTRVAKLTGEQRGIFMGKAEA